MRKVKIKKHRLKKMASYPKEKYSKLKQTTRKRIAQEAKYYANGGVDESVEKTEKLVFRASLVILVLGGMAVLLIKLIY